MDPVDDATFRMVDVGGKAVTRRRAVATGRLRARPETIRRVLAGDLPKGDALALAEVAGIMAAKRTPDLLPLCHPLPLDSVRVALGPARGATGDPEVEARCEVVCQARTGVEMEALIGVQAALACVYDLAKAIDPALEITDVRLVEKEGGKSGRWTHPGIAAGPARDAGRAIRDRVVGIVLAGGASTRMGVDKATLDHRGLPLLDHAIRLVAAALGHEVGSVRVSGDRPGHPCIADEVPGGGPLGGIASCLRALLAAPEAGRPDLALVVPVDMPRLEVRTLEALVTGLPPDAPAAHYAVSELPLVCRVTAANADLARRLAASERRSIRGFLAEARARALDPGRVPAREFTNLNTPDDWRSGA
ncbi:MAG: cyclic pyranopterin monophosphate synthase MoaC [Planctomycetaceae bacterium]